jgi:hypothetical protein
VLSSEFLRIFWRRRENGSLIAKNQKMVGGYAQMYPHFAAPAGDRWSSKAPPISSFVGKKEPAARRKTTPRHPQIQNSVTVPEKA